MYSFWSEVLCRELPTFRNETQTIWSLFGKNTQECQQGTCRTSFWRLTFATVEHSVSKVNNSVDNAVAYPPVEIVVVAHASDEWFEDVLSSFAIQDYPDFKVTVLTTGDESTMQSFVSEYLPEAEVIPVDSSDGHGKNLNTVLSYETNAAFFLFCDHDVALAPDALRLMVEESLRSNASVIGPKIVNWDRPDELLDIGCSVDKLGYQIPRIEPGELDQEQHDAVSDVFVISSTVALVRADLFRAISGFDEEMGMIGEDLDMCWRAHVAGARVITVPLAVARHREEKGEYRSDGDEEKLRERHRLRTILSNYGLAYSLLILPQAFLLSLFRSIGSLLVGDFGRVRVLVGSWIWNLSRPRTLFERRKKLKSVRRLPDIEVRALQSSGYALFKSLFKDRSQDSEKQNSGMVTERFRRLLESMRAGPSRVSVAFVSLATLVFFFGSRHLITRKVPVIGELVPFDVGIQDCFSIWFSNWWVTGIGHESTSPTAIGLTGFLGIVFLGSMGLLRLVLTLGMLPIGVIGMWNFLKPFNSPWVKVAGASIYLASPVPYEALGSGSWGGLILYGTLPWLLVLLGQAAKLSPFGPIGGASGPGIMPSNWLREALGIGALVGFMIAFFPFASVEVIALVAAIFVGSLLSGWPSGALRLIGVLSLGLIIALAVNLPWLIDVFAFDPSWEWLVGTRPSSNLSGGLSDFLQLTAGRSGNQIFGWGFLAIAVVPLILAKGERWAWAVRSWVMYLGGVSILWVDSNQWLDISMPRPEILLAPASIGVAVAGAMGVGALQRDLQTYRFGWRQLVPISTLIAFVLVVLPVFGNAFSGDWGMPDDELNQVLSIQESDTNIEGRVLWIGHDDLLAAAGSPIAEGLTFSVTSGLKSSFLDRWDAGPEPGDYLIEEALLLALDGGTTKLGRLLAPLGISEIVLVGRSSPLPSKGQIEPIPSSVEASLGKQLDLIRIVASPGIVRYENVSALPAASVVSDGHAVGRSLRSFASDPLPEKGTALTPKNHSATSYSGFVERDSEIFLSVPSTSTWKLSVDGVMVQQETALEWAVGFQPEFSGAIELSHVTPSKHRIVILLQAFLWILVLFGFLRSSIGSDRSLL